MKNCTFTGNDPVSIITFLQDFKTACDAYNIHEDADMWLIKPYIFSSFEAVFRARMALLTETAKAKEWCLNFFPQSSITYWNGLRRTKKLEQATTILEIPSKEAWRQPIMPKNYGRRRCGTAPSTMRRFWKASLSKACIVKFVEHFVTCGPNTNTPHWKILHREPSLLPSSNKTSQEAVNQRLSKMKTVGHRTSKSEPDNHEVIEWWISNVRPRQDLFSAT